VPIVVIERTAEKAAGCTLHLRVLRQRYGRGHDVASEDLATRIVLQG
jgi:hypothetical protein